MRFIWTDLLPQIFHVRLLRFQLFRAEPRTKYTARDGAITREPARTVCEENGEDVEPGASKYRTLQISSQGDREVTEANCQDVGPAHP